jgi:hypothetical protein
MRATFCRTRYARACSRALRCRSITGTRGRPLRPARPERMRTTGPRPTGPSGRTVLELCEIMGGAGGRSRRPAVVVRATAFSRSWGRVARLSGHSRSHSEPGVWAPLVRQRASVTVRAVIVRGSPSVVRSGLDTSVDFPVNVPCR